jgi:hypothetical protein
MPLRDPAPAWALLERSPPNAGLGTSCDYSHTGTISFGLPGNVSYTSASGVFLTQTAPEPGAIVLTLIGMLLLFAGGRNTFERRRSGPSTEVRR